MAKKKKTPQPTETQPKVSPDKDNVFYVYCKSLHELTVAGLVSHRLHDLQPDFHRRRAGFRFSAGITVRAEVAPEEQKAFKQAIGNDGWLEFRDGADPKDKE